MISLFSLLLMLPQNGADAAVQFMSTSYSSQTPQSPSPAPADPSPQTQDPSPSPVSQANPSPDANADPSPDSNPDPSPDSNPSPDPSPEASPQPSADPDGTPEDPNPNANEKGTETGDDGADPAIIVPAVVGGLTVAGAVVGILVWRRRRNPSPAAPASSDPNTAAGNSEATGQSAPAEETGTATRTQISDAKGDEEA